MKTKDIMKILKLVKKSRKHKKRKRHHSKKKVIIAPTQNILPSALQPYEISRQVPMTSTNNLSLDNLRLTNTLLENKIKEGPEIDTKINDINNKLLIYDTNKANFDNELNRFNRQLLGLDSNYNNQINTVNNRLNNQDVMTQSAISESKNYTKTMDDKIENIYNQGQKFITNAIERKFNDQKLIDNKKPKFIDDDSNYEDVPETKDDKTLDPPADKPPNIPQSVPLQTPVQLKSKKRITSAPKIESYTNFEADIKGALEELDGITTTDLDKEQLKKYGKILNKYKISFGSNTKKKARVIQLFQTALDKK
jgi:hypothetical protein